jgi:immune inhibitor A
VTGEVPTKMPSPSEIPAPAATEQPTSVPSWPAPAPLPDEFSKSPASNEQLAAFDKLTAANPPIRNDIELSAAYGGWEGTLQEPLGDLLPLLTGARQELFVLNRDTNTHVPIQVELQAVSDHAYFWFDTGPGSVNPEPSELSEVAALFDRIYEVSVEIFGSEPNPGVDGDPRLHIVNASPLALCDVTEENADQCGLAGYFDHSNLVPSSIEPTSNAREMFTMNVSYFGSDFYLNILAHEMRHMIENNQDPGEIDWVAEGSAMLAEDLNGLAGVGLRRGNMFLTDPDQQLNSWTDGDATSYYGQGYLLNRYIYDRLGPAFYHQLTSNPETGLRAIDAVANENGLAFSGIDIWLDWLAALAVHDRDNVPEEYIFDLDGLDQVAMMLLDEFPVELEETVNQFAADYYQIVGDEDLTITFEGSSLVPILGTEAASGDQMWVSPRANLRHMHLTRPLDLRNVEAAALSYSVFHDIEAGYDYGYVLVSEDGGQSWDPLVASNMQGDDPSDDPSQSALTGRFYTGQSDGWVEEQIDLTPYAGKEILMRFAYVTDLIYTLGGLAIDNISVPEIGLYDDGEDFLAGWDAQGFERVTASIPQKWHLQLITFPEGSPEGGPKVQLLELSTENELELELSAEEAAAGSILIVSASAPRTLEPAHYRLTVAN